MGSAAVSCPAAYSGAAEGQLDRALAIEGERDTQADTSTGEAGGEPDAGGADASVTDLFELVRLGRLVPMDGEPLTPFFDALARVESGDASHVRILQYGDSHTAADFLTTAVRRALQKRFGDGGRGFVLLGRPWPSYRPKDVLLTADGSWRAERILVGADPTTLDGRYGLPGVAVESREAGARAAIATIPGHGFGDRMSSVEVFYLEQPEGGSFVVRVDGKRTATVSTAARRLGSGFLRLEMPEGGHEVELRLRGDGMVRLFGAAVENDGPGVVLDTLGLNGAFFYTPLRWDASLLAEQVERRAPDLIVTMYGANEADSRSVTPRAYARDVAETIRRLRAGAPEAACLMLGPTDRRSSARGADGRLQLDWIVEVQAEAADAIGCAFLDTRALMGGAGSHGQWVKRGLAQPDGVHLNTRGYALLGEVIAAKILTAYDARGEEPTGDANEVDGNAAPDKAFGALER